MSSVAQKISLVVFAAHHLSENIASQRFKALLKYFDPKLYDIHIFARSIDGNDSVSAESPNITVYAVSGSCVGSGAGSLLTLLVLLAARIRVLPYVLLLRGAWAFNALREASVLLARLGPDKSRVAIIATYSPIDALVAGQCLGNRFGIPCVLDFRDGLAFESHGRKGLFASTFRRWVESWVVNGSILITTVSRPLVKYFRSRYPMQSTSLLPNGYDPAEVQAAIAASDNLVVDAILAQLLPAKKVLGHFGRIGASDASATYSLKDFADAINASGKCREMQLLFVGHLSSADEMVLERVSCMKIIVPHVQRGVANILMRRMDGLLLITGERTSCATGKLFEYIAAGPPIGCFSAVPNEAARILDDTGCGQTIIKGDRVATNEFLASVVAGRPNVSKDAALIGAYSRSEQAKVFSEWIQNAIVAGEGRGASHCKR